MADKITVALIYDFDGTLAPGNMQEYDFIPAVGKSNMEFWHEANTLAEEQDADQVLTYMARMIQAAQSKGLSLRREAFRESGRNVKFYAGVEEWFKRINEYGEKRGVNILHYVNSSGLKEIIEGTAIAHEFKNIYACSFLYNVDGIAYWPAVAVNYTNKTQFIFKINKGEGKDTALYAPYRQRGSGGEGLRRHRVHRAHSRRHRRCAPELHGSALPQPRHGRLRFPRSFRAYNRRGYG